MTAESDGSGAAPRWRLQVLRALAAVLVLLAVLPESRASDNHWAGTDGSPSSSTSAELSTNTAQVGTSDDALQGADRTNAAPPLAITRVWSPVPSTARVEGVVSNEGPGQVQLIFDGDPLETVRLQPTDNGRFEFSVEGLPPGPHTLCLDGLCERVFIADPNTEAQADIEARIDEAVGIAATYFDLATHLPGWSIEATGPNSNTGGYTDAQSRTIFISANPGRSVDALSITVLHELAHAVDATHMDDAVRDEFRALRNHDPALPWGQGDNLGLAEDRWQDSAEDFAEVFVAWRLGGDYLIASDTVAPQPTADELVRFCQLVGLDGINCG